MIQSTLHTHERKLLDKREGTTARVRKLLSRADNLEILEPGEDLDIFEIERQIPMSDGTTMPIVLRIIRHLLYPTPGYGRS